MRICICDDNPIIVEYLSESIHTFFARSHLNAFEISVFQDGNSLLKDQESKDLVFLDIEMPDLNGIDVGQQLVKLNKDIIIIIVTSYNEYLDDAMKLHVFRYLSKPIDEQRLFRCLREALESFSNTTATLPIETKDGVHTVLTSHIISVEAADHKVIVHTIGEDYYTVQNMPYWLDKLPSGMFFQSHRSYIINFTHVTGFDHGLIHLYHNQYTAYLTRRKYTAFKNAFLLYMETH